MKPQPTYKPRDKFGRYAASGRLTKRERNRIDRAGLPALRDLAAAVGIPGFPSLVAWRDQLISDHGGAGNVTAAEAALIDEVTTVLLLARVLDFKIRTHPESDVLNIIRDRSQIATRIGRLLGLLGLGKTPKSTVSVLDGYR